MNYHDTGNFVQEVEITTSSAILKGILTTLPNPKGTVIFAHGAGSSRLSPRNQRIAHILQTQSYNTLLFDLLTPEEDAIYDNRFNIDLLTDRLTEATQWFLLRPESVNLPMGYFGASTGAAAAIRAAIRQQGQISAVVSRGGRPDLVGDELSELKSPVLLIVGGNDKEVLKLNREAFSQITQAEKRLVIIPDANHLFEEPGALDEVARLTVEWFNDHFCPKGGQYFKRKNALPN